MRNRLKKSDIVIYASVIVLTLVILVFFIASFRHGTPDSVKITYSENTAVYALSDEREVGLESGGIFLTVKIADGKVSVISSSCPDKCCVKKGEISKCGESIVCLPAKCTVTLIGEDTFDANAG